METPILEKILKILHREVKQWKIPVVGVIAGEEKGRPFRVLISTVLSLRTKDATTEAASLRLFAKAPDPASLAKLPVSQIEKLIYPVSFYRVKAGNLVRICEMILNRHAGIVPSTMEKLLAFPGVGRKTANLVLTLGFDDYGICVDTHVHRITNRWDYIRTKNPDETEMVLRTQLPKKHWKTYNDLLVAFGQNLCVPISPWCSRCPLDKFCPRRGVTQSR